MMLHVKFTKLTSSIALALFSAYFFYGLFRLPFTQYLVSLAVGGIAYGISDSYEIAAFSLLLMNFIFPYFGVLKSGKVPAQEGFVNPAEISQRIRQMQGHMKESVQGVGSPMSEGFADVNTPTENLMEQKPPEPGTTTAAPAAPQGASTNAPAAPPQPVPAAAAAVPDASTVAKLNATLNQPSPPPLANQKPETFQDNGSLFKLGQIPTDAKGGYHIDAGTTVINALNALKPDQIQAMTKDTRQLIETQKSLMSMLQTFSPMVNEGKQMMDTFNTMFAPTAGALQNAQAMVAK